MTEAQLEPYLVMATRTMLFEDAVMGLAGVTRIPTFDDPYPAKKVVESGELGKACGGTKVEGCRAWLQERAPKRTVNGKEIRMVVTHDQLADTLCRVCKKG